MTAADLLGQVVAVATTSDALDVLVAELRLDGERNPGRAARRLERLAALADADRQYAELMRRHDALYATQPAERLAA